MEKNSFIHYTMDIKELDDSHWALFEKMNLIRALDKKSEFAPAFKIFILLAKELKIHYLEEEVYMYSVDYPYVKAHVTDHEQLARHINQILDDCEKSQYTYSLISRVSMFSDSYKKHIDYYDIQFSNWMKAKLGPDSKPAPLK